MTCLLFQVLKFQNPLKDDVLGQVIAFTALSTGLKKNYHLAKYKKKKDEFS